MVMELLSYTDSILNPLLKWLALVLFGSAAYFFYRCRCIYGGKLQRVATLLLLGSAAGILSSLFRIAGDSYIQWKWGESTLYLALAIITLVIAYTVRLRFKNATALFGVEQEREQQ